jgi:hypothetical protein
VCRLGIAGYLLDLLVKPEAGVSKLLGNIAEFLPDYMASHRRDYILHLYDIHLGCGTV